MQRYRDVYPNRNVFEPYAICHVAPPFFKLEQNETNVTSRWSGKEGISQRRNQVAKDFAEHDAPTTMRIL